MSGLSTHILDTANGKPAAGVAVHLYLEGILLNTLATNADGRIPAMLPPGVALSAGIYRLVFEVTAYFPHSFFPEVIIVFEVRDAAAHYHVPLLLSPFGYSTYRGS
jgi:5-hydroxyisourate hydrolase